MGFNSTLPGSELTVQCGYLHQVTYFRAACRASSTYFVLLALTSAHQDIGIAARPVLATGEKDIVPRAQSWPQQCPARYRCRWQPSGPLRSAPSQPDFWKARSA